MQDEMVFDPKLTLKGETVVLVATLPGSDWSDENFDHAAILVQQGVAAVARATVAYGAELIVVGDMDISLFVAQICHDLKHVSGVESASDEPTTPIHFFTINFDKESNFKEHIAFFQSVNFGKWKISDLGDVSGNLFNELSEYFENHKKPSQVFVVGGSDLMNVVWAIFDSRELYPPILYFEKTGSKFQPVPIRFGPEPVSIESKFNLNKMIDEIRVLDWTQIGEESNRREESSQIEPYYPYEILAQHALSRLMKPMNE